MDNGFTIIRDSREKPEYGWSFPETSICHGTIIHKLNIGDYSIAGLENYICIERKRNVLEWANNCNRKRWRACMQRMSTVRFAFLLMCFDKEDLQTYPRCSSIPFHLRKKINMPAAVLRKEVYLAREQYGIHVLFCPDQLKAEQLAYRILRKAYATSLRRREL